MLFEFVAGGQAEDGILAILRETESSADSGMDVIFEFGLEIDASVLLGLVGVESEASYGIADSAIKFRPKR